MTKATIYLLNLTGIISMIYFAMILVYSGIKTSFLWFWPFLAACCAAVSFFLRFSQGHATQALWRILSQTATVCVWLAFLSLLLVEGFILNAASATPSADARYMIILGAQVRGDTPSLTLKARIDTAAAYLKTHPDVIVICSGGQGSGENISEAAAIQRGLLSAGIGEERIRLEDASTSTVENLRFCKKLLPSPDTKTIIVTNDFHCCRAGLIAKKCGYTNSSTLPAKKFLLTTPHYFVREFFAVLKDFIAGNL